MLRNLFDMRICWIPCVIVVRTQDLWCNQGGLNCENLEKKNFSGLYQAYGIQMQNRVRSNGII